MKSQVKSVPTRIGPTESDIKDKIRRLYQIFTNKVYDQAYIYNKDLLYDSMVSLHLFNFFQEMISKLPDKGQRIQRQIAELHKELEIIGMEKGNKDEIIDLDDISEQFHRAVNV